MISSQLFANGRRSRTASIASLTAIAKQVALIWIWSHYIQWYISAGCCCIVEYRTGRFMPEANEYPIQFRHGAISMNGWEVIFYDNGGIHWKSDDTGNFVFWSSVPDAMPIGAEVHIGPGYSRTVLWLTVLAPSVPILLMAVSRSKVKTECFC